MTNLWQDIRYGLRLLTKSPGFTITVLISLALGIGAATAIFSVIHGVLMNPYPYPESDRMVSLVIEDSAGNEDWAQLTGSQLLRLRNTKAAENVLAQQDWELSTTGSDLPEDVRAVFFTPNASAYFGVPASLGRGLVPSDAPEGEDPQPVVVLSHLFWQRHFGSSPSVVGKTLQLDRKNYTVVGVLPSRFAWSLADVYLPLKVASDPSQPLLAHVTLRPGVSLGAADAEFQALFEQFAKETPTRYPAKFRVRAERIIDQYGHSLSRTLYLLFGAVAVLLLIGCANVSILLLARGASRRRELAVRAALGARRARILRQLLTESLLLSLSGAALGVLLAFGGVAQILKWLPEYSYPHEAAIQISLPALCFSVAVALLTTILFGLAPALQLSKLDVGQIIQSRSVRVAGGLRDKHLHNGLISAQIALVLLLLTAAGASTKSFLGLMHSTLGFDPHNVLGVWIPLHDRTYTNWQTRASYFDRLRLKVAAIPDVDSAAISSQSTPPSNGIDERVEIMGRPGVEEQYSRLNLVSSEYFPVLRIPLLQGRVWDLAETMRGARVAVVNDTMAREYWPHGDALGHALRMPELRSDPPLRIAVTGSDQWFEIIGVVSDARNDGLANPVKPAVYMPYTVWLGVFPSILVRTREGSASVLPQIRAQIRSVDLNQQVAGNEAASLQEIITTQPEWQQGQLILMLFAVFGSLALTLAVVGLYSVVSYVVAQRTNEFGIRMALGALPGNILRLVFTSTAFSVGSGLAAGVALSLILSKLLATWVESSSRDPLILLGVTLLLVCSSFLAAFFPARRASCISPMEALRHE
jgi:predicted permease